MDFNKLNTVTLTEGISVSAKLLLFNPFFVLQNHGQVDLDDVSYEVGMTKSIVVTCSFPESTCSGTFFTFRFLGIFCDRNSAKVSALSILTVIKPGPKGSSFVVVFTNSLSSFTQFHKVFKDYPLKRLLSICVFFCYGLIRAFYSSQGAEDHQMKQVVSISVP